MGGDRAFVPSVALQVVCRGFLFELLAYHFGHIVATIRGRIFCHPCILSSFFYHAMKSSLQKRHNPRFVTLFFVLLFSLLASPTNVHATHMAPDVNMSPGDWKSILANDQGRDACSLKEWLASSGCQKDANGEDENADEGTRRALVPRGDLTPSPCQCTVPYFNILCGCLLSNGSSSVIPNINYTRWKEDCKESGSPVSQSTSWIDDQDQDIPDWAFVTPNGLTFDSARVLRVANRLQRWSTIQIITPIITVISTLALLGIVYLFWYRRQRGKAESRHGHSFFSFVRKMLMPRSRSVRHPGRNDTWQIDDHGRERSASDSESFSMVPNRSYLHRLVESPIEATSYWSPDTDIRQPSHINQSVDHQVPFTSTMRNIRNRVRQLMPWGIHPHPVINVRRGSRYRIDGDQTRSNTLSSISTSRKHSGGGIYRTIKEEDEEYAQMIGRAGDTSTAGHGQRERPGITASDREAVAESVILIGDRNFTLESGSTGHSSHPRPAKNSPSVAYARGHGIEGILTTPESAHPNVHVESPSPTLDLHSARAIPTSPGAPPLLPPPPQERPPLPPIMERNTPRRSPSPHLRISTEYDSRDVSKSNPNREDNTRYQRDPSASSGTNALSYVTTSPEPHLHPKPSFDNSRNAGAYPTMIPNQSRDISVNPSRPGSGSRLLPQSQPEPLAPSRSHSNVSRGQISVSRAANIGERSVSPSAYLPQPQNEFDPYEGIPHSQTPRPNRLVDMDMVNTLQRHAHTSSVSLPRSPGEPEGQPQRGWSADDEMDRASLLIDQPPMQINDGMSGVYITTPRDVRTIGRPGAGPRHWSNPSAESFATVLSSASFVEGDSGESGRQGNDLRFQPESPTLSMLEKDLGSRPGFATYAGRESLCGSSGWDASTQGHGGASVIPPISRRPPLPTSSNQQPFSSTINVNSAGLEASGRSQHGFGDHNFSSASSASRSTSPGLSHVQRLGSDVSINDSSRSQNRSREDILSPPRNDPLRLFPDSVRAAGYTIGLRLDALPLPPRSPRLDEFENVNGSSLANSDGGGEAHDDDADGQHRDRANFRGVTGSGPLAGYVERDRTQSRGGGTWGTDSSGVQTILEAVQQLPEPLNAQRERTVSSLGTELRTPPGQFK